MYKTYELNTDEMTEPEEQLRFLMLEDLIIVNNGWWNKDWPKDHITIHVICNDVFAWGAADSEDILQKEIQELFDMHLKDPDWGSAAWCIKKRKLMPQTPVEAKIREAGIWNLEELLSVHVR